MARQAGCYLRLSLARKIVGDLLDACRNIPLVSVARHMNVRELVTARMAAQPRPSWNSIFTKAYAKVAAEVPEFRQLFICRPWHRLYQHAQNRAMIAVETEINGEKVIVPALVDRPESSDLLSLDRQVAQIKQDPGQSKSFRRSMRLARLPRFLRRCLWWLALDWSGPRRAHLLGTYGVTSVSFAGADAFTILTPLANLLHYGPIDSAGDVRLQIVFDHRIMDGALPSRALVRLEKVLHTEILAEVRGLAMTIAA